MKQLIIDRMTVLKLANDQHGIRDVRHLAQAMNLHENTLYKGTDSNEWSRKLLEALVDFLKLDSVDAILRIREAGDGPMQ